MLQEMLHGEENGTVPHASPNTPFYKQLRWLIHNPPEHSVVMQIGPKEAAEMLRYNTDEDGKSLNRPKSAKYARQALARQMKAGRWIHTGQPIIFSDLPRLIDGQHRLEAIIEAGVTVTFDVRFGIADRAFSVIDIGKKRTASDIFAINKIPNHTLMAAAMRWVHGYQQRDGFSGTARHGGTSNLTPEELFEVYHENVGIQESAHFGYLFAKSRTAPPAMMTALHYLCAQKSRLQADMFFEMVGSGFGFPTKTCPAFRLHRRLLENATSNERVDYTTMAAYTIKAWNAMRRNQPVGILKWSASSEKFPRIV